jgi:hypothetical protein
MNKMIFEKEITMQINKEFPKPKFQIGQRVKVKANYSMVVIDKIYIVVQITLACMSVLTFPSEKEEPFDYMLLLETDIGKPTSQKDILWIIRESFIEGIE